MTKRRWPWVVAAVVVVAAGTILVVRDPLLLPGDHKVTVYALDDAVSKLTEPPGWTGRLIGMCDADSYYAEQGDKKLCLVLGGPLGDVRARRKDGVVTVAAGDAAKLRTMAAQDTATTTLVLMAGGPAALIPVADLAGDRAVSAPALS